MSAAEKLERLAHLPERMTGIAIIEVEHEKILDVLPEIIAVVKAAEADVSLHQFPADLASCPNPLCVALAALDEKL